MLLHFDDCIEDSKSSLDLKRRRLLASLDIIESQFTPKVVIVHGRESIDTFFSKEKKKLQILTQELHRAIVALAEPNSNLTK